MQAESYSKQASRKVSCSTSAALTINTKGLTFMSQASDSVPTEQEIVKPHRVQLSRKKGWRMPPNTVKVDRATEWGNPVRAGLWAGYTDEHAVADFRRWIMGDMRMASFVRPVTGQYKPPSLREIRAELGGKNLACWCKLGDFCHADVLLEIANEEAR